MDKEYLEWAENEVELAKKDAEESKYSKELDCALSLFKQMNEKEGLDVNKVFFKLERLFHKLPLTPITENDNFEFNSECGDGGKLYACKRVDSLLKYVSKNDEVSYENMRYLIKDVNHYRIVDSVNYLVANIFHDIEDITLPYYPNADWVEIHVRQGKTFETSHVDAVYIDCITNMYDEVYHVDAYFILEDDKHWKRVFKEEYDSKVCEDFDMCDGCDGEDCDDCDVCAINDCSHDCDECEFAKIEEDNKEEKDE